MKRVSANITLPNKKGQHVRTFLYPYFISLSHFPITFFNQGSSASFGEQYATASATVRKILSSPRKFAKFDVWSLSITNGPGFARTSCSKMRYIFS